MSGTDWRALAHAEQLLELRRDVEAELCFLDVLVDDPAWVRALVGLAQALNRQERHAEAEAAVRRALALAPEDVAAHHLLTDILCDQRRGRAAVAAAETGLRLAPHHSTSHFQYARALLSLRRPKARRAHEAALRAVELAPHDPDAHNLVGLCLAIRGRRRKADASYRRALALDPHHSLAQNNLAAVDAERGRLGEAADALRRAAALDPQHALLRHNLDVVLLLVGRRLAALLAVGWAVLATMVSENDASVARAVAGTVFLTGVVVVLAGFRRRSPRGLVRPSRVLRDTGRAGPALFLLLAVLLVAVLFFGFAPQGVLAPVAHRLGEPIPLTLLVLGMVVAWGMTTPRDPR